MDDDQDPFGFTVFGTDYVDYPYDWRDNQFKIKNEAEWRESVHKCYTKVPKETLQRFKFVYNMDTEEQQDVKSQAAIHAYHWVLDEFDKDFSQASNRDEVKSMLESQVNYFFCCLRTFLPITTHCKVDDFENEYPQIPLYICPFGRGAANWRKRFKLEYLVDGKASEACDCCKADTIAGLRSHLNNYGGMFSLHEAVGQYLEYCDNNLTAIAPQVVVKKHGKRIIKDVRPDTLANLNTTSSEGSHQTTDHSTSPSEEPPNEIICDHQNNDDTDNITIPKKQRDKNDTPAYTANSKHYLKKKQLMPNFQNTKILIKS